MLLHSKNMDPVAMTTLADSSGNHVFANRQPGDYFVKESNLSGSLDMSDMDCNNSNLISICLLAWCEDSTGNIFVDEPACRIESILLGDTTHINNA
jgi:hypothetical protein